jgi:hypothetical protein
MKQSCSRLAADAEISIRGTRGDIFLQAENAADSRNTI